jgi:hypothetical protein
MVEDEVFGRAISSSCHARFASEQWSGTYGAVMLTC